MYQCDIRLSKAKECKFYFLKNMSPNLRIRRYKGVSIKLFDINEQLLASFNSTWVVHYLNQIYFLRSTLDSNCSLLRNIIFVVIFFFARIIIKRDRTSFTPPYNVRIFLWAYVYEENIFDRVSIRRMHHQDKMLLLIELNEY